MTTNIIVAVSGGPDSMYLLYKLLNDKKYTPIVAHVNYHLREFANRDQKIVKDFCRENNITFNLHNVEQQDWDNTPQKNKQSKARHIRYEFFNKLAQENKTDIVFIGHHLDDWIESAIMQENKSDEYLYYGIKSTSKYKQLIIKRPLLNIFKEDIIKFNIKNNIPYGMDETNDSLDYERNRIRKNVLFVDKKKKRNIIKYYSIINRSKKRLEKKVTNLYLDWKDTDFNWKFFSDIKSTEFKRQLIYKILRESGHHINISFSKIEAILDFIKQPSSGRVFRLMENIELTINKGNIYIQLKNGK